MRLSRVWIASSLLALCPAALAGGKDKPAPFLPGADPGSRAVLLILIDDLSPETLARIETPNIDALAARSVSFTNVWSAPVCSPSRAMILTGRMPTRTGIGMIVTASTPGLPFGEVTIPELVGGGNGFGKWHLSHDPLAPLHQGFDYYAGTVQNIPDYHHWEKNLNGSLFPTDVYATDDTVREALAHPARFTYVALHVAHKPIHRPPGFKKPSITAMVRYMDESLGPLLDAWSDGYVILTADNGSNQDFGGAKGTLLERGINVPLFIAGPGVVPGTTNALVNLTDLYATVADLLGATSQAEDSISLLPYLLDPDRPSLRNYNYTERFQPNGQMFKTSWERAVRDRRYKLVRTNVGDRFFDLLADPGEEQPLPASGPAFDRLSAVMEGWFL